MAGALQHLKRIARMRRNKRRKTSSFPVSTAAVKLVLVLMLGLDFPAVTTEEW